MSDSQQIDVDGVRYEIVLPHRETDYIQRKIWQEASPYELDMLRDMFGRISADGLVLDIGANIGNHTLYLATRANCRVHSFEPNKTLCDALAESLRRNNLNDRVVVHPVGVGREAAKASFAKISEENLGEQSLEVRRDGAGDIDVVRLDDLDFGGRVNVLKIDVEGMELAVLEGAVEILRRDMPHLYVECQEEGDFNSIHTWLEPFGYCYWDTFNATPTHLFIHSSQVSASQHIERLMAKAVRDDYRRAQEIKKLHESLNSANLKYRSASEQIASLKAELSKAHAARNDARLRLQELETLCEEQRQSIEHLLLQADRDDSEREIVRLRENLHNANLKYKSATEQISLLQAQLAVATAGIDPRVEELEVLCEQQRKAIESLSSSHQRLQAVWDEKRNELERKRHAANIKYRRVTGQFDAIRRSRTYQLASGIRSAYALTRKGIRLTSQVFKPRGGSANVVHEDQRISHADPIPLSTPARLSAERLEEISARLRGISGRRLSVACIMDEFTYHSFLPECDLHALTPNNWESELQKCRPDMLFVESAWRGKDESWGNKVGHTSSELQQIVNWCREHDVPTVFWNKEDPVHFQTFLNTANLCEFVFTTDIDCIHRYKAALGHDRVYLLPFACQPRVHNPIETYDRKDAFCFAGAYYAKYPERAADLGNFVKELPKYRPLEIFDRNYGKDHPDYKFPDEYQPYIVGTLPFNEVDRAYKGYRYAINLNSIKQSQTMFARRVFELLASNTITVSNYSRGLRLLFGDLVIASDDGKELVRRAERVSGDDLTFRKFRLAALRKVMREHTYEDRLAYIVAKLKREDMPDLLPRVIVVGSAQKQDELNNLVDQFGRQTYRNRKLVVVVDGFATPDLSRGDVELIPATKAAERPIKAIAEEGDWIAAMVGEDYYGPNYLTDLALATRYSEADAIGKLAHYSWQEGLGLNPADAHREYRFDARVAHRASLIRGSRIATDTLRDFAVSVREGEFVGNVLGIDAFNYCLQGSRAEGIDLETVKEAVDDLKVLDEGISITELTHAAEMIAPEQENSDSDSLISGKRLGELFRPSSKKQYSLTVSDQSLVVGSRLADGKHDYIYSTRDFTLDELGYSSRAKFYFDVEPGLNLQLVIVFLDAKRNRIAAVVSPANKNHDVAIPEGTNGIRLGLRIYGSGRATVQGLFLGHRRLQPAKIIARSRYLLLTNHYPSHDDLYRNAFVHARVRAYREQGVDVDVFRLRKDEPVRYHEFENIDVMSGSQEALDTLLADGTYEHVLVHFLDPDMWEVLQKHVQRLKITVWVHGSEIQPWHRRQYNFASEEELSRARQQSEERMAFWRGILQPLPENMKLVFVSEYSAKTAMEDLGVRLPAGSYAVIHNPIDTDLFSYREKRPEQRLRLLSIRPYSSKTYANDLSVEAIRQLKDKPWFSELSITMVGDGILFDQTIAPLKGLDNVRIEQQFLPHREVAELHRENGVFLVPSRMDSQGVSRDEAMSSGLVPITNAVAAIPEFVDEDCGILAPPEDAQAIADGIEMLYHDPERFLRLSRNAARRVRQQSSKAIIIQRELDLFVDFAEALQPQGDSKEMVVAI